MTPKTKKYEIEEYLRTRIRRDKLAAGTKLPSSNELADKFGVNRNVVRAAVTKLTLEGLVYTVQGCGCFVAEKPSGFTFAHRNDIGFSDVMRESGLEYSSKLLKVTQIPAVKSWCKLFGLEDGEKLYRINLLRSLGDSPIATCQSLIPERYVPDIETHLTDNCSVNDILSEKYGYAHPVCGSLSVSADMPEPDELKLLGIGDYVPILQTVEVFHSEGVGVIEYYKVRARGDRFKFRVES